MCVGLMVGLIFLLGGCYILYTTNFSDTPLEGKLFAAGWILFGVFILLTVIFGTLESAVLDGENLIFSYRLKNKIYKASMVASIAWGAGMYIHPNRSMYGLQYAEYTVLFIKLKNGKTLQIPGSPYASNDIEKILLDWQERYNPPES